MSRHYYPRARVKITATVQTSRARDELEVVEFEATPRSVKIDRNEFSKADECTLELDSAKFPVLPRNLRQALCLVYLGDTGGLGRELDDSQALWLGYIDDPELSLSESDGKISWKGRDYTAILLDARRPPLRIVPTYGDSLDTALRRILDDVPGGENIKLRLVGDLPGWPTLADAAAPGLLSEKIHYDPNDTIWKLIERVCDPFGLIPQIKLDTLEIGTPRGARTPTRVPLFSIGNGGGIEEYRERRLLSRIHEGILLSGYDLSTQQFVVVQWPPSGDQEIAKKLKATKVVTSKSGRSRTVKKPATVGANAAPVNPNDKRHGFSFGNVANEDALLEAAKSLYESRSRQEFEGSFKTHRFRVPNAAPGEPPDRAPLFDVTQLTSGDRVSVDVLPSHRSLLDGLPSTQARIALLQRHGYDTAAAALLVKVFERGAASDIQVYVRSLSLSLSEGDGFSMDVQFQALLSAEGT